MEQTNGRRETRAQRKTRKRSEAAMRGLRTSHPQTKAHRLGRCDCARPGSPEERLLATIFGGAQ